MFYAMMCWERGLHRQGQKEIKQVGSESCHCPGLQPGLYRGGGRLKDVGQAYIHQEQVRPLSAKHCGGPGQLLQHETKASSVQE